MLPVAILSLLLLMPAVCFFESTVPVREKSQITRIERERPHDYPRFESGQSCVLLSPCTVMSETSEPIKGFH